MDVKHKILELSIYLEALSDVNDGTNHGAIYFIDKIPYEGGEIRPALDSYFDSWGEVQKETIQIINCVKVNRDWKDVITARLKYWSFHSRFQNVIKNPYYSGLFKSHFASELEGAKLQIVDNVLEKLDLIRVGENIEVWQIDIKPNVDLEEDILALHFGYHLLVMYFGWND